jgi:protein-S-isoprenylcysteine O-methyltransferase Ste14
MSLAAQAWLSLVILTIIMGVLLFVPAGTIHYWEAWVYLGIYAGASALIIADLLRHDPALLRRRMRGGPTAEKTTTQRLAMLAASIGFIALLIIPAFDHRFQWSHVPAALVLAGDISIALSFYSMFVVFRANPYGAATIQIADGQTVITTGPYAKVRHPMYAGASFLLVGTPLALGSWWGLLALIMLVPAIVWRMLDEEKFLAENLPGYAAYMARVRYRLIPNVF